MKLVLDFVFIIGFLISVSILYLLNKNSSKELHKQILQIIFVFVILSICSSYAYLHKIRFLFYGTFIFDNCISYLIGPLLLLYIKSIFLPTKGLIKKNRRHFIIPVVFIFVFTIPSLISTYNKKYLFDYIEIYENSISLVIVYSLIYCIFSLKILKKAKKIIKHNYSNLDGVDLSWIRRLLIGVILIISIDIFTTVYEIYFGELMWNTYYLTSIAIAGLIIYLGYYGVLQSKVLISQFLIQQEKPIIIEFKEKVTKPYYNYNTSELIELEKKLHTIMQTQKPFLDENLSLKSLAKLLAISDKKLSSLLNQHIQVSFYDYVNSFRVQCVIDSLKDTSYDKYTLLAIAFESGFKSKTSFNRTFKKVTHFSPSEYKRKHI